MILLLQQHRLPDLIDSRRSWRSCFAVLERYQHTSYTAARCLKVLERSDEALRLKTPTTSDPSEPVYQPLGAEQSKGNRSHGGESALDELAGMPESSTAFVDAVPDGQYLDQGEGGQQQGLYDDWLPSLLEGGLVDEDWLSAAPFGLGLGMDASGLAF